MIVGGRAGAHTPSKSDDATGRPYSRKRRLSRHALQVGGASFCMRVLMMVLGLPAVLLVLAMCSTAPFWGHSRSWGYGPSGGAGVLLVIVLCIWFFMGRS